MKRLVGRRIVKEAGLESSGGKARKLIQGGGAKLNDTKLELSKLRDENAQLKKDNAVLRLANLQLKDELEIKGSEIDKLKQDLAKANTEIDRLEKENREYKIQAAKLRAELTEAAKKLDEYSKNAAKTPDKVVKELQQENELMKQHIVRMIRSQERRRLARELVLEELKKFSMDSSNLLQQIDVVFHETGVIEELHGSIVAEIDQNPTGNAVPIKNTLPEHGSSLPLPSESENPQNPGVTATPSAVNNLAQLLIDANKACEEKRFVDAEIAYQDYLRAKPNDAKILANLGLAKLNLQKYKEADIVLRDSLKGRPGDPYANFLLGVNSFHRNDLGGASDALNAAVLSDPGNAKAHHYLGVIALKNGKKELAINHFLNAVKVDTGYATAHYNLAVLYATVTPQDIERARHHYDSAIDSGASPDESMEKLLASHG